MSLRFLSFARSITAQVLACALASGVAIATASGIAFPAKRATLEVDGVSNNIVTGRHTVGGLLKENGIKLTRQDRVQPAIDTPVSNDAKIVLRRAVPVTIGILGGKLTYKTAATTVDAALDDVGLSIAPTDRVDPPLMTPVEKGMFIKVTPEFRMTETSTLQLPFKVIKKKTRSLPKGKEVIARAGQPGEAVQLDERVYSGTYLASRNRTQQLVKAPVDQIVRVGLGRKSSAARSGRVLQASYSPTKAGTAKSSMVVEATAYVPGYAGVGYRTATGARAGYGIIAVDPRVIPLGTRLYVPGYGYGIAADTGGAIKGNRIDVCYNSVSTALNWGRRSVRVQVLK